MSDIQFIKGLYAKAKHPKAPSFVICKLSANRQELITYLQSLSDEWVNMEMKENKKGTYYITLDTWKPNTEMREIQKQEKSQEHLNNLKTIEYPSEDIDPNDIPF